jgi:hypothetical protein
MVRETLLVYSALVGWSFAATILPLGSEPAPFAGAVRPFILDDDHRQRPRRVRLVLAGAALGRILERRCSAAFSRHCAYFVNT